MKRSWSVMSRLGTPGWLSACSAMAIAVPMLSLAAPAHAQQGAETAAAVDEGNEEKSIVVTGSRLGSGFEAPTPVTTVGAAQIQDRALTSVAELSYEIPQLRVNQNVGRSSEPVGQNQIDLRALGSARTLVLLDGRRMAATSPFGGIDSNVFPLALINNVEVVTGGASAAYGSDAVAGVINFGLQKDFTGLKLDASYGVSKYSDFRRPVISGAAGTSLFDDRLHLTVAGDFYRNTGQTAQASRPWGQGSPILFANPTYTKTNGQTQNYVAYDGRLVATFGGLITGINADTTPGNGIDVLRGIQFGTGGTVRPFTYGSVANTTFMLGGDGVSIEDDGNLLPHITRYSAYGRASFDISDRLTIWTDTLYSKLEVYSDLAGNYDVAATALDIRRDNAFLPTSVRDLMVANNIQTFKLSRVNREDGYAQNNGFTRALRYAAGLNGKFGDWEWDFTLQRSDNRFRQESLNNRLEQRWKDGVDAVLVNGQPVCRINADASSANDNPACVAINVFGAGSISPAAQGWYKGTAVYSARMTQNIADINVRGKPFSTWAGEVNLAVGGQYRKETITNVSDANSVARAWRSINQQPFSGELTVKEAYLETGVPLARDMPFADNLELNGAVRYADYSSSGGVTTWKVGLNYNPIPDIRLRGTISRDIRAANINELFAGQNQVLNTLTDTRPQPAPPAVQHPPAYTVLQLTGGNSSLTPEKATTKSFGLVVQPSFLPGLSASIDYYTIKINNAIVAVPSQTIVNNCYLSNLPEFCDLITVNVTPTSNLITRVVATIQNAQTSEASGIDLEVAYRRPLPLFGTDGTLSARLLVNYVEKLALTVSGITTSYVGDLATDYSGQPRWKWNYDLGWAGGPVRVGAYLRYIGGGKFRSTYVSGDHLPADQNRVKGKAYVDLSASYKLTNAIEIYGKVDNLFDNDPPILPNNIIQPTVANSQMYDKIGRYYVIGARLRF